MELQFSRRTALLILWDIAATFIAYFLAALLTGLLEEITTVDFAPHEIYFMIGVAVVVYLVFFLAFRLYNSLWEYASLDELCDDLNEDRKQIEEKLKTIDYYYSAELNRFA